MVTELHKHDIIWGGVHPGNIVIDKDFNARIVDFGGGWVEEFVRRHEAGTKEAIGKEVIGYLMIGSNPAE
jgi:hypothetical protein